MDTKLSVRTAPAFSRAIISLFRNHCFSRSLKQVVAAALMTVAAGASLLAVEPSSPLDKFMVQQGYETIQLWRGVQNRLFVEAKFNGESVLCLIDTGVTDLVLDTQMAHKLKLAEKGTAKRRGPFGTISEQMPLVSVDRFELGGVALTNQDALTWRVHASPNQWTRTEIHDGIVGLPGLRALHAWFDCYALRLYIRSDKPAEAVSKFIYATLRVSGAQSLSTVKYAGALFVRGAVNDQPATFEVDSGAFDTLLEKDELKRLGISNRQAIGLATDLGGHSGNLRYANPESLKFGDCELKRYPVGTVKLGVGQASRGLDKYGLPQFVGLMGADILDKAGALIDCEGNAVFVRQVKKTH